MNKVFVRKDRGYVRIDWYEESYRKKPAKLRSTREGEYMFASMKGRDLADLPTGVWKRKRSRLERKDWRAGGSGTHPDSFLYSPPRTP